MIMITWGVFKISTVSVHDRYSKAMVFVKIVAVLSCLKALGDHFAYQIPPFLSIIQALIGVAAMFATVFFCVAMRWLSAEANLESSVKSWKTTTILFTIIYLIPLGMFYCLAAVAIVTGESFNISLGPAGLFLLPVFFLPFLHLFVSTSRMKNAVQRSTKTG
jgi:hypothetical protein